ncbi:hypothetical protein D3C87_1550380 [compost metagenome]
MEIQHQDIVGLNLLGDAVLHRLPFFFESAKHAIENDQHATVVLVDILVVSAMMGTVMGRCIEDVLNPARKAADQFGMNEILIGQIHGQDECDCGRRHTEEHGRKEKDETPSDHIEHRLSCRRSEVHALAGMMNDVRRPKPADSMAGAMKPVVAELDRQNDWENGPTVHRDIKQTF